VATPVAAQEIAFYLEDITVTSERAGGPVLDTPTHVTVVGTIARGPLGFRGGTPAQLESLGIANPDVQRPHRLDEAHLPDQGEALCVMPALPPDPESC